MPFKYNALLGLGLDNTIPLDGAGKIPSTFLPSYVDDVEEYNNLAAFPATGETGKIYVAIDTGFVYRWSGSVYVQIGITAAAGSTTQVQFNDAGAFGGDAGLTYDKSTDALTSGSLRVTSAGAAATPSLTFTGDPNTGIFSPGADQLAVATNGVQRINIEADGDINIDSGGVFYDATNNRLAINTTTPEAQLHIAANDDNAFNAGIRVARTTIPGQYVNLSYSNGLATLTAVDTVSSVPGFKFQTSTNGSTLTERVRIDTSNRLLVGTSTAQGSSLLQLQASGGATVRIARDLPPASFTSGVFIGSVDFTDNAGNNYSRIIAEADGTAASGDYPGRLVFSTTADGASSPTEAMRINSQQELLVGTATRNANGGVLQLKSGITFPATAVAASDANTLDDYEEGTWTPVISGTSTAGTATYATQTGRYTKTGRTVFVEIFLNWSGGTGTGTMQIEGLPFNAGSYVGLTVGIVSNVTLTALNYLIVYTNENSSVIALQQTPTGGGGRTAVTYDASGELIISGTYSV